jgi:tetratricopeptide (TPR) repeat protein
VSTPTTPIDVATALLREGRSIEAEELMVRVLRTVTAKHGSGSPAWASAQCDLGNVLLKSDQLDRAIGCYRNATSARVGSDPQNRKDHLTYRLNLGMALQSAGRLREAESVLRKGVRDRRAFYGREHAGYAFGLEPLAAVLLQRGKVRKARKVIEEAVYNFLRNGHEHLASALVLRRRS